MTATLAPVVNPADALASAVDLALRDADARLARPNLSEADREALSYQRGVYARALALATGDAPPGPFTRR